VSQFQCTPLLRRYGQTDRQTPNRCINAYRCTDVVNLIANSSSLKLLDQLERTFFFFDFFFLFLLLLFLEFSHDRRLGGRRHLDRHGFDGSRCGRCRTGRTSHPLRTDGQLTVHLSQICHEIFTERNNLARAACLPRGLYVLLRVFPFIFSGQILTP